METSNDIISHPQYTIPVAFQWRPDSSGCPVHSHTLLQTEKRLRKKFMEWALGPWGLVNSGQANLCRACVLPAGGQDRMYPVQCTTTYWGSPSLLGPRLLLTYRRTQCVCMEEYVRLVKHEKKRNHGAWRVLPVSGFQNAKSVHGHGLHRTRATPERQTHDSYHNSTWEAADNWRADFLWLHTKQKLLYTRKNKTKKGHWQTETSRNILSSAWILQQPSSTPHCPLLNCLRMKIKA